MGKQTYEVYLELGVLLRITKMIILNLGPPKLAETSPFSVAFGRSLARATSSLRPQVKTKAVSRTIL